MKRINAFLLLAFMLGTITCDRYGDPNDNPAITNMWDLVVDDDFNWSASLNGELIIKLTNPYNTWFWSSYTYGDWYTTPSSCTGITSSGSVYARGTEPGTSSLAMYPRLEP